MTARILPFVRAEHATRTAVPSDAVPHPLHRGTVAATHPVAEMGGGRVLAGGAHYRKAWVSHLKTLVRGTNPPATPVRRLASVSPTASRTAPTTALGNPVVGAQIGPAGGSRLPHSPRPGWHGGDAA